MFRKKIPHIFKIIITIIIIHQIFSIKVFSKDDFKGITEYPVLEFSSGIIIPGGRNVRNSFNNGVSFTIKAKIPKLIKIKNLYLDTGIESGFYNIGSEYSNLLDIPIFVYFGFSRYDLPNRKLNIIPEVGFGIHMQSCNNNRFNGIGFGITPNISIKYKINKKVTILSKLRIIEIIRSQETQEWVDLRLGFSYTILDQPIELHKPKPMYK